MVTTYDRVAWHILVEAGKIVERASAYGCANQDPPRRFDAGEYVRAEQRYWHAVEHNPLYPMEGA